MKTGYAGCGHKDNAFSVSVTYNAGKEQGGASTAPTYRAQCLFIITMQYSRHRHQDGTFNADRYHRRSIRIPGHDYTKGIYFVTTCVHNRECLFGVIAGGQMQLNETGLYVDNLWKEMAGRYATVIFDAHIVMPNHVHTLIRMPDKEKAGVALPEILRVFKSLSAIEINRHFDRNGLPAWQRSYYEHVVRTQSELSQIRKYIADNPHHWIDDPNHPSGT